MIISKHTIEVNRIIINYYYNMFRNCPSSRLSKKDKKKIDKNYKTILKQLRRNKK